MKKIFKNFKEGILTTVIGLLFIVAALVGLYFKNMEFSEASLGVTFGLILMGLPDPKLNRND